MTLHNIRVSLILAFLLSLVIAKQALFNKYAEDTNDGLVNESKQSKREIDYSTTEKQHHDDDPNFDSILLSKDTFSDEDWDFKFTSSIFPSHQLRIKSPKELGIDTVNQFSGYITVDNSKNFFFLFFESRNDPENDPLILWLNGGPGCSSLTGLFTELGPSRINLDGINLDHNPYSWNNKANLMFLDQPLGTGFSYSTVNVSSTLAAAQDVYAFLVLFFKNFPQYKNLGFHIAGESYAGHYIPAIAKEILQHTKGQSKEFYPMAEEADIQSIPKVSLESIMIGNGYVDTLKQYMKYPDQACDNIYGPVLSEYSCAYMREFYPVCAESISICSSTGSDFACVVASDFCDTLMFDDAGLDVYDVRRNCSGGGSCYPLIDSMTKYLNQPSVMKAIGAEVSSFSSCNDQVSDQFAMTGDEMKSFVEVIPLLLEQGIPVLVYAGNADYVCNSKGCLAWAEGLEWSGRVGFSQTLFSRFGEDKNWGLVKSFRNFTFLSLNDAGHFVPYNVPEVAEVMVEQWIKGNYQLHPILP